MLREFSTRESKIAELKVSNDTSFTKALHMKVEGQIYTPVTARINWPNMGHHEAASHLVGQ